MDSLSHLLSLSYYFDMVSSTFSDPIPIVSAP
jgi:hypothetical protein